MQRKKKRQKARKQTLIKKKEDKIKKENRNKENYRIKEIKRLIFPVVERLNENKTLKCLFKYLLNEKFMSAPKKIFKRIGIKVFVQILILPYHETIYNKQFDINWSA